MAYVDYLNSIESEYRGIRRTLRTTATKNHMILRHLCHFHQKKIINLAATLELFKLHLAYHMTIVK